LEGQVPVFITPRNRRAHLKPQALGSLFVAFYDSQGYDGGIRPHLYTSYSPLMAVSLGYMASAWTPQKTSLRTVTPLLLVTQPLPSNGCFSGCTVLALSKYATIYTKFKFTVETGSSESLLFPEILVNRKPDGSPGHTEYKATDTELHLLAKPHHHPLPKHSVLTTLINRAKTICDTE
jgi:hypothetical protein